MRGGRLLAVLLGFSAPAAADDDPATRRGPATTAFERSRRAAEAGDLAAAAREACARADLPGALALVRREIALREGLADLAGLSDALRREGLLRDRDGDFDGAAASHRRAYETAERTGDAEGAATALAYLGNAHFATGEYARALSFHEQALERFERAGDTGRAAATLANLAAVHQRLGASERALAYQQRALARFEEAGDVPRTASALGNLGSILFGLGETERAVRALERSRRLCEGIGDRAGVAEALSNLALVYGRAGSLDLASSCHRRAWALREEIGDRPGAAATLAYLGILEADRGRVTEALALHRRALAEAEVLGDRELTVRCLWAMAATRLVAGEAAEALASAHRAVEEMPSLVRGLSETQGAASRQLRAGAFEVGVRAALELDDAEALFFFLESGRAGTLLESLGGREPLQEVVLAPALRETERAARLCETRALAAYREALDGERLAEIRARRAEFQAARDAVRDAVERIQREAKAAADLVYPRAAPLEEVQGSLEDGTALVVYGVLSDRSVAVVVTAEDARIVPLGPSARLRALCEDLGVDAPASEPTEGVRALSEALVLPLSLGPAVRTVLVSPDGPLSQVPFGLLLPGREVAYLPSATTWRLLLAERDRTGTDVLALGDPDYETDGAGANRLARLASGVGFVPLPGTREEALRVGDVVLLGAEATEEGLAAALSRRPRWRAVHLACHGVVDPRHALQSSLALTPAGADDGFLSALEVFRMRIPSDLAVLSACQTGKGRAFRGEGLVGFVRAFLFAGSPRVVVSLWNGDDRSTHALMTEFHRLWKEGRPTAQALREAQAAVRSVAEWEHPYYWAGWTLWGLAD